MRCNIQLQSEDLKRIRLLQSSFEIRPSIAAIIRHLIDKELAARGIDPDTLNPSKPAGRKRRRA